MKKKSPLEGVHKPYPWKELPALHVCIALGTVPITAYAVPPDEDWLTGTLCGEITCVAAAPVEGAPLVSPPQRPLPRATPPAQEFSGIPWHSFLLFPEVVFATTYDDNIYARRRNDVSDTVFTLSPSIVARSRWKQHALNLQLGADVDRYRHHGQEDVTDYWAGFDGRFDVAPLTNIFGGVRYSRDHEDRSASGALSPTEQIEPTQFDRAEAHLGVATGIGPWRLRMGGTYDEYDYKDGLSALGTTIDSDFRDRFVYALGVRLSYVTSERYEIFAQYATDVRSYRGNIPSQGFSRDSGGYRAALGLRFTLVTLRGEAYAGVLKQEFDYAGFNDVSEPYYGALATWRPTQLTTITAFIDRSLEETTVFSGDAYASSSLDTTYGFDVEHKLRGDLTLNARASYTRSRFQSFDRLDTIIDAAAGFRYYVMPTVFVGGELRLVDRNSRDLEAQYSRNQLMLNLGYTPGRNKNYSPDPVAGAYTAAASPGLYSGLYAGAEFGHGALSTNTGGVRHEGGSDAGDFGDFGENYVLFAGWGKEAVNWYFGLEAEAADSNARWYHSKSKDESRTEYVNEGQSQGLGARVGYMLEGGLLYGKLGLVRTDFRTYLTTNRFMAGAFDRERSETGTRWGVGLDIPASPNVFVRMSYSHTDYGEYDVTYQTGLAATTIEKFDLRKDVFGVGLGWRFGANRPQASVREAADLRGFYAGAGLGHGTLNTELTGLHRDQGTGPYGFTGDFSGSGVGVGAFAGYGHTFGRIYLGVELEAGAANYGWYHERESEGGGRDFAVEKRGSYGVSLRLGYVLSNGSLLYGRIGHARTRFNTIYSKGPSTDQWIDRADRIDGTRLGLGAEVPAARNAFVRMDYTYTKYDAYGLVTGHGGGTNADEMTFNNRENLFRLSLGFRF